MVTFEVLTHPQILSPNTIPLFDGSKPCKWPEGWYVDPSPNMVHRCVDFCLEACSSWAFWVISSGIDGPCCWPKPWSSSEPSCGALSEARNWDFHPGGFLGDLPLNSDLLMWFFPSWTAMYQAFLMRKAAGFPGAFCFLQKPAMTSGRFLRSGASSLV